MTQNQEYPNGAVDKNDDALGKAPCLRRPASFSITHSGTDGHRDI